MFMSPCASIQSRPIGRPCVVLRPVGRRRHRAGGEAVIAAEHERQRAFVERRERGLIQLLADPGDVVDVLLVLVAQRPAFPESAPADRPCRRRCSRAPAIRSPSPAMRNADGPMSTPRRSAAEIERHADDVDGTHQFQFNQDLTT